MPKDRIGWIVHVTNGDAPRDLILARVHVLVDEVVGSHLRI